MYISAWFLYPEVMERLNLCFHAPLSSRTGRTGWCVWALPLVPSPPSPNLRNRAVPPPHDANGTFRILNRTTHFNS